MQDYIKQLNIKRLLLLFILLLLFSSTYNFYSRDEFEFRSGYAHQGGSTRHSVMNVVVNRNWHDDELPERVEAQFILMNGKPTTLKLNLYYSIWHLRYGAEPYKTLYYEYPSSQ